LPPETRQRSDLNQQPRAYLGPRYAANETLQDRYVSQWNRQRPPAEPQSRHAPQDPHPRADEVPPYRERHRGAANVPPGDQSLRPSPAERPAARQDRREQHPASNESMAANDHAAAYRPSVQRVEMRYPGQQTGATVGDEIPSFTQAAADASTRPLRQRRLDATVPPASLQSPPMFLREWSKRWQRSHLRRRLLAIVSQGLPSQKQSTTAAVNSGVGASPHRHAARPQMTYTPPRTLAVLGEALLAGRFAEVARQLSWPDTVRMGLLSVIIFLLWWTWPSAPTLPATGTSLARNALAMAPAFQANAENRAALALAPQSQINNQSTGFTILVPTATPEQGVVNPLANNAVAPAVVSMRVDGEVVDGSGLSALNGILVATATPARIDAAVMTVSVPKIQIIPGVSINLPFGQPTPTPTPEPTPTPTPVPINLVPGRLWSTFAPGPESDHFWVGRSFAPGAEQLASPSYQFGSTAGDRYRTHHGVDISNPFGTPVLAATDGEVVHAGLDDPALLGPYNNFYGNAVVIRLNRKLAVAGGELDVFLLYGHLSQVTVQVGDQVRPEDVVGMVGMTGIAIGPHLHVEIRLGANTYFNNVNPYLWVAPLEGNGAVAVRVLTADGRTWPNARISLVRYAGGTAAWARQIITYMDVENIGPDPAWGENGAMDGVPAGSYYVIGVVNGERLSAEITVEAGRTSFVELRTQQ